MSFLGQSDWFVHLYGNQEPLQIIFGFLLARSFQLDFGDGPPSRTRTYRAQAQYWRWGPDLSFSQEQASPDGLITELGPRATGNFWSVNLQVVFTGDERGSGTVRDTDVRWGGGGAADLNMTPSDCPGGTWG